MGVGWGEKRVLTNVLCHLINIMQIYSLNLLNIVLFYLLRLGYSNALLIFYNIFVRDTF